MSDSDYLGIVLIIAALIVFVVGKVSKRSINSLARKAIQGRSVTKAWKNGVRASQSPRWSLVIGYTALFIVAYQRWSVFSTDLGGLAAGILAGAVLFGAGQHLVRNARQNYWEAIAESLDNVLPAQGDQRAAFKVRKPELISGTKDERAEALSAIINPAQPTRP